MPSLGTKHQDLLTESEPDYTRRTVIMLLRTILALVALILCIWTAATGRAAGAVEYPTVPSAGPGRDIPVAFGPVGRTRSTFWVRPAPHPM